MKAAEIRKLASDPEKGVPADAYKWEDLHWNTKEAIIRMMLALPPWGSPRYGENVRFLPEVAFAMHPESKGKDLAARIIEEKVTRFMPG